MENDIAIKAIRSSSSMDDFCKQSAAKIANFYDETAYPLERKDIEHFFDVIAIEVEKIFDVESN